MFTPQAMTERVIELGMMVGMRGAFPPDTALRVADTVLDVGFNVFELTMNSEQPLEALAALKREYGERAIVGVGTVLDVQTAKRVMDAGADFVVSPAFQPAVVEAVHARGVWMIPGVMTPSEAVAAWQMDVPLLKLFPVGAVGVEYFKAMLAPLDHMRFMCNGAVNAENTRDFLKAGAVAIGMGGWLTGDGHSPLAHIRSRALQLQQAIAEARGATVTHNI